MHCLLIWSSLSRCGTTVVIIYYKPGMRNLSWKGKNWSLTVMVCC